MVTKFGSLGVIVSEICLGVYTNMNMKIFDLYIVIILYKNLLYNLVT